MRAPMITAERFKELQVLSRRDDACDRLVPSDIRELLGEIERMDAAFHFLSNEETSKRLRAKTPEKERRVQFEKTEADAIARHLSRNPQN